MNVLNQKDLLQRFDQQQRDHPLGGVVAKFVDNAIKKHSPPPEKKQKKHSSTRKRQKSANETQAKPP
ncbi:hypothetical protein M9Y10_025457 [Tritrichomonas musculus]|uniref:Uncharacterized protein n=1 Tax=Tritrichomonas musculus TaxID=1915356 RepID=A0ABR2H8R9_9EUKA